LLDFSEEHQLAQKLIRAWCTDRLAPRVPDLEDGVETPYALMRDLCATFGGARTATEVAMEAVQLKGGAGYMRDGVVEMLARDAKLLPIGGGTDEIQILRIARQVLAGAT
jgi:alkylation response protein AidB-like acyl-CoA dehydrogenase